MSATRTQVYLTREQRARVDEVARLRGKSMAEVVREAIDAYLASAGPDAGEALKRTYGAAPGFAAPPRAEWRRRDERLARG